MDKHSRSAFQHANQYIPNGVSNSLYSAGVTGRSPFYFQSGNGTLVTDVDGNEYIDLGPAVGATFVGHAHPAVSGTVIDRFRRGVLSGLPLVEEARLAEKITTMVPAVQKVRFVDSRGEAVGNALDLARQYNGRRLVVVFDGSEHGGWLNWSDNVVKLPYNDEEAFRSFFAENGFEVAAVLVEPVASHVGVLPASQSFLKALRRLSFEKGALLVFDESVTGFRLARGGAAEYFSISPDLVVLGGILGGGLPLAALGGRADVMERLVNDLQPSVWTGNAAALEAGFQTLSQIDDTQLYVDLNKKSASFFSKLKAIVELYPVKLNAEGSMFTLFFSKKNPVNSEETQACDLENFAWFYRSLLKEGVVFSPSQHGANFVTPAHTEQQLRLVLIAVQRALSYVYGYVDNM